MPGLAQTEGGCIATSYSLQGAGRRWVVVSIRLRPLYPQGKTPVNHKVKPNIIKNELLPHRKRIPSPPETPVGWCYWLPDDVAYTDVLHVQNAEFTSGKAGGIHSTQSVPWLKSRNSADFTTWNCLRVLVNFGTKFSNLCRPASFLQFNKFEHS